MEDGDGDWKEESGSRDTSTSAHGQQPEAQCSPTAWRDKQGFLLAGSAGKKAEGPLACCAC